MQKHPKPYAVLDCWLISEGTVPRNMMKYGDWDWSTNGIPMPNCLKKRKQKNIYLQTSPDAMEFGAAKKESCQSDGVFL